MLEILVAMIQKGELGYLPIGNHANTRRLQSLNHKVLIFLTGNLPATIMWQCLATPK